MRNFSLSSHQRESTWVSVIIIVYFQSQRRSLSLSLSAKLSRWLSATSSTVLSDRDPLLQYLSSYTKSSWGQLHPVVYHSPHSSDHIRSGPLLYPTQYLHILIFLFLPSSLSGYPIFFLYSILIFIPFLRSKGLLFMTFSLLYATFFRIRPGTVESAIFKADRPESRKLYLAATAVNSASSVSASVDNVVKGQVGSGEHARPIYQNIYFITDGHIWQIYLSIHPSIHLSIWILNCIVHFFLRWRACLTANISFSLWGSTLSISNLFSNFLYPYLILWSAILWWMSPPSALPNPLVLDWLTDCVTDSLTDWLTNWLIDWLTD